MAWKKGEGEVKPQTLVMREWMKTEAGLEYKKKNAEKMKRLRSGPNKDKYKATQQRAVEKMRLELLQHYSEKDIPRCKCCGVEGMPFLTIDHINGDGAEHRRQLGMTVSGTGFWYWLKKNNYPEGFQVLCANCNFAKRAKADCPHKTDPELYPLPQAA